MKTHPTQSANSFVFGTVAESKTIPTCSGSMIMTSSQTTPRCVAEGKIIQLDPVCASRAQGPSHLEVIDVVHLVEDHPFDISDQVGAL